MKYTLKIVVNDGGVFLFFFQVQIFTTFSDPVSFVRDSFGSGPEYDASIQNVIGIQRCLYEAYQEAGHNGKTTVHVYLLKIFY